MASNIKKEFSKRRAMESEVSRAVGVALAQKGLKWKDAAAVLGVSCSSVSNKKNGNSWTVKDLVALSL